MNIIQKLYPSEELLQPFVNALDQASLLNAKICVLEILTVLIRGCRGYFKSKVNMKGFVKRIVRTLLLNSKQRQVMLPTLEVILSLRDKNYDGFMAGISSLSPTEINKVPPTHQVNSPWT